MADKFTIAVRDFTPAPGPRYRKQGLWSGEEFRETCVEPALRNLKGDDYIIVDLDGTSGFGSSFLEEAFGGLIRKGVLEPKDALRKIKFVSVEDGSYEEEAKESMEQAMVMKQRPDAGG